MVIEKVLTDEEIIAIGQQARAIESGENGYILPVTFARAIEQAVLQSPEIQALRKEAELWEPIISEIHRRAGKEHTMEDRCDFTVTIDYEDYAAIVTWPNDEVMQFAKELSRAIAQAVLQLPEIQALRKDAARYRYIKKGNQWIVAATQTGFHIDGGELDDLIDNELEKQK